MRLDITILHASEDGVAPSFILSLCSEKSYVSPHQYLFNVPEGFSRLALEHRARPGLGLKSIFTTGVTQTTTGGLGGLMLRLKSDGHGEVHLMGPRGMERIVKGLREGIEVNWMTPQLHVTELTAQGKRGNNDGDQAHDYEDPEVQVDALHLQTNWNPPSYLCKPQPSSRGPGDTRASQPDRDPEPSSNKGEAIGSQPASQNPGDKAPNGLFSRLDELLSQKAVANLASGRGRGKQNAGSLLKTKVLELLGSRGESSRNNAEPSNKRPRAQEDVEPEPFYQGGADQSSSSVAGYLVHFPSTGQVLVVISCSHLMLLDPLAMHPMFSRTAKGSLYRLNDSNRLLCTLHLTPSNVAYSTRYQEWMNRLPGHHAFASSQSGLSLGSSSSPSLGFMASARLIRKLNRVSSVLFPLPKALHPPSTMEKKDASKTTKDSEGAIPLVNLPKLLGLDLMSQLKIKLIPGSSPAMEVISQHASDWPESEQQQAEDKSPLSDSLSRLHQQIPELNKTPVVFSQSLVRHSSHGGKSIAGPSPTDLCPPPLPSQGWLISIATYILDLQQGLIPRSTEESRHLLHQPLVPRPPSVDNRLVAAEMRKKLKTTPGSSPAASHDPNEINPVYSTFTISPSTLKTIAGLDEEPIPRCLTVASQTSVAFLGTGSAEPSKHRGPSSILLSQPSGGLLMDVGEGTFGQLRRYHGDKGAARILDDLKLVWISHKHADHTLGLLQILNARPLGGGSSGPLVIVGPSAVEKWLKIHYANNEEPPHSPLWIFVHCSKFNSSLGGQDATLTSAVSCLGLIEYKAVPVHHCKDSYGLVIKSQAGWKIVYSGDCRPSVKLQQEGEDATLLIHESTFDPSLSEMALQKRHSTSSEAADVARGMRAYRTILTHFSQRYPKIPDGLLDGSSSSCPSADPLKSMRETPMVAFDGLVVPLTLLPVLPLVLPSMRLALHDAKNEEV